MDIHACLTFWICYLLCSFCFFLFPSSCGVHTEPRWTQNSGENINVETEPVKRKKMDLCFSACGGFQYVVSAPFYRLFLWGWENSREEDVLTWNTPPSSHQPPLESITQKPSGSAHSCCYCRGLCRQQRSTVNPLQPFSFVGNGWRMNR